MRFYRLDHWNGGTPPAHPHLKTGAIIRVARKNSQRPGDQWNADTREWVTPVWVECADPREVTA